MSVKQGNLGAKLSGGHASSPISLSSGNSPSPPLASQHSLAGSPGMQAPASSHATSPHGMTTLVPYTVLPPVGAPGSTSVLGQAPGWISAAAQQLVNSWVADAQEWCFKPIAPGLGTAKLPDLAV